MSHVKVKQPEAALSPEVLLYEQMHSSVSNYLTVAAAVFGTTLLIYFALLTLSEVNLFYLNGWLVFQCSLCCSWLILYYSYHDNYDAIKNIWEWWIEIPLSIACGLGWSAMWILFVDSNNLLNFLLLNAGICAITMVVSVTTPLHKAAIIATTASIMAPVVLSAFLREASVYHWIGLAGSIFSLAVYSFGMTMHKLYMAALEQREENAQLVQALRIEKRQVEKVSAEKTRFLAVASHDLRQPLQAMRLFTSVLESMVTVDEEKAIVKKIGAASADLSGLLDDLLDISKFDAGIVETYPEPVYLGGLFSGLYEQLSDLANERQITIRYVNTEQQLFIDGSALERVLRNLLVNAIKHMGRPGKVLLGTRRHADGVRIDVIDNGRGIPEEEQSQIFDEFYQLNNPERNREKGLGLGLSIVKRLCRVMNCELTLQSKLGVGSRFSILLPEESLRGVADDGYVEGMDMEAALQPDRLPVVNDSKVYHGLILEDDAEVANALMLRIKHWGYRVTSAPHVEAALNYTAPPPDFILSDYQLANGETGLDAIEKIQAHFNTQIPALIITGNTEPEVLKLLEKTQLDVLHKPVDTDKLNKSIKKLLVNLEVLSKQINHTV